MTKLEAVNSVLMACGMPTVAALDTGARSMASEAERAIDEAQRKVENEIQHYGEQKDLEITANGSGYILIPADTIQIDTYGSDSWRDLTPDFTNGRMYDRDNQTDVFTVGEIVKFRVTTRRAFTFIPPLTQEYIVARAAAMHNTRYGFPGRVQVLAEEERRARVRARAADTRMRGLNLLDTDSVREIRGDRGIIDGTFVE